MGHVSRSAARNTTQNKKIRDASHAISHAHAQTIGFEAARRLLCKLQKRVPHLFLHLSTLHTRTSADAQHNSAAPRSATQQRGREDLIFVLANGEERAPIVQMRVRAASHQQRFPRLNRHVLIGELLLQSLPPTTTTTNDVSGERRTTHEKKGGGRVKGPDWRCD